MSYGVVDTGFEVKSREQLEADMQEKARNLFGPDVNLSNKSPLGLLIQLISWPLSLAWKMLQGVYSSAYVDFASGQSLDAVGKYIGISRRPAAAAIHYLHFTYTGKSDLVIEQGFIVETGGNNSIQFQTIKDGTITVTTTGDDSNNSYTLDIQAECTVTGSVGNVPLNTLTVIRHPVTGLSVTNTSIISNGLDQETDDEFRERYRNSVAKGGASTIDSIIAALLEVPGVQEATVIENDTMTQAGDIPPKSIKSIVYGGKDPDIAAAIFASKPAGIQSYGLIPVPVFDLAGISHSISFSRAFPIDIYVTVTVKVNQDYPADGDAQIQEQIESYINDYLRMGQPVVFLRIPDYIFNVPGVDDVISLKIGRTATPTGIVNISLQPEEIAQTDSLKVVVNRG